MQYLILRKEFIEVLPDAEMSVAAAAEKDQVSDLEMAAEKRRTKGQLEGPEERKESTDELESREALGGGAGAGAGAGQFIRVSRSRSSVVNFDKWLATKLAAASEAKDSHPLLLDAGAAAEAAAGAGAEGATEASRIPSTTYQRITTPGDETAAAQLSARISVKRQPSTVAIVAAARRRHSAPDLREDISSTTAGGLHEMESGSAAIKIFQISYWVSCTGCPHGRIYVCFSAGVVNPCATECDVMLSDHSNVLQRNALI